MALVWDPMSAHGSAARFLLLKDRIPPMRFSITNELPTICLCIRRG